MYRGRRCIQFVSLLFLLSLTGCWDQKPVESRAAVAAIGIDPAKTHGLQRYTFVFPDVTVTASSLASTTNGQEFFSFTVTAPSLIDALNRVQSHESRSLYLGQVRIVALSTRLSAPVWRRTLYTMADAGRFVLTFWVVAASHARQVVTLEPPTEVVPEVALYRALNCHCQPIRWPGRGWKMWTNATSHDGSLKATDVNVVGRTFVLGPLVVMGSHAVKWSASATKGWAYLTGHVEHEISMVHLHGHLMGVGLIRGNSTVSFHRTTNGVHVTDQMMYSGVLMESPFEHGARNENARLQDQAIESAVAHQISAEAMQAWRTAQTTHADPMGWHRDASWNDSRFSAAIGNWHGWHLHTIVHFTLREEGVLR